MGSVGLPTLAFFPLLRAYLFFLFSRRATNSVTRSGSIFPRSPIAGRTRSAEGGGTSWTIPSSAIRT